MKDQKSEVENVIKSLIDFEKHLDEIKEISIERKENLIKITETEVEKIKNEILQNANKDKEKNVSQNIKNDESKAKEIIKKGEQDREKLQKKIDTKFNSAVKDVKKKIIGV
tara:strand:+ start:217 stop:549 length:333 start_codon:yes stop_codon:yes gene_type:complete